LDAFAALQHQKIDLLFLDIQMPQMTGFGLLRSLNHHPYVILTTAHREFALESYDFQVMDYLLKPISFDRFLKTLSKIYRFQHKPEQNIEQNSIQNTENQNNTPQIHTTQEAPFIYIKSERQFVKVLLDEILYIESVKNHVQIFTETGNYFTLLSISEIEEKLPPQRFIRIHRSFLVATAKITQFTHSNLNIGDALLPIGQLYKNEVLKKLNQHLI
jgi:DNA-binding LytR/AlgR family response regulator